MEEEVEDMVGEVAYTDSQKTLDCDAECYSDKNYSSGRETYVLDVDESSDSDNFRERCRQDGNMELEKSQPCTTPVDKRQSTSSTTTQQSVALNRPTNVQTRAVETFTQTSKTIIELAQTDYQRNTHTLQTQTSFVCITERTVQYTALHYYNKEKKCHDTRSLDNMKDHQLHLCLSQSLEDYSSKCPDDSKCSVLCSESESTDISDNEEFLRMVQGDTREAFSNPAQYESQINVTDYLSHKSSDSDSIYDEDSLAENNYTQKQNSLNNSSSTSLSALSEVSQSADNEVKDLYSRLSESMDLPPSDRTGELDKKKFGTLTPLSEESLPKKISTDALPTTQANNGRENDVFHTNEAELKVEMSPEPFKLPPIQRNLSCPNSPHLSMLFGGAALVQPLCKAETLPCLFEAQDVNVDRWTNQELASGEHVRINKRKDSIEDEKPVEVMHLPPIHQTSNKSTTINSRPKSQIPQLKSNFESSLTDSSPICIQEKIKELKMNGKIWRKPMQNSLTRASVPSRSLSPMSTDTSERLETVERGCDALCQDMLRRLRLSSWVDVAQTLDQLPIALKNFWGIMSEQRIADFIRQLNLHVDSPRTRVARTACATLASVLKNTNYTKKPDFYEAVTLLLQKTGSFSRPVRRAANVALDEVVCNVELNHAVAALCVHGVEHKSPLVRSAAARLLVVCAALGGGGRELLRGRPSGAAGARRQTLLALSLLLDDRCNDARHYAERLYTMLRPLPNFEAYFLTDVSVEVASRQMKKCDRLLMCERDAKATR